MSAQKTGLMCKGSDEINSTAEINILHAKCLHKDTGH